MKTLADAFSLRNRMIEILERADLEEDPDEKRASSPSWSAGGSRGRDGGRGRGFRAARAQAYYPKLRRTDVSAHLVELRDQILPEMPGRWVTTRAGAWSSAATRS